ncbi:hypothetical protein [Embleya sp. NBC_00896]|uniref:hypothetical protein n=1 Tax=Embleya sp. NBC_00896 TaxID=2975961 RepID=UPI00386B672D|nr:hypothetical protein OG928_29785 [Embleya sp. NBC_00896]
MSARNRKPLTAPRVRDAVNGRIDLDLHGRRDITVVVAPAAVFEPGDTLIVTWTPRTPTLIGPFEVREKVRDKGVVHVALPHAKVLWSTKATAEVSYRLVKPDGTTVDAPRPAIVECVAEYPPLLDFADVAEALDGRIRLEDLEPTGATVTVPYTDVPVDTGDTVVVTWTPRTPGAEPFETRFAVDRTRSGGRGTVNIPLDRVRACAGTGAEVHYRLIKRGNAGRATSGRNVFDIDPTGG